MRSDATLFARRPRRRRGPGLTPLIDVVFLLLVFFMLASRFDRESLLPLAVRVAAPAEAEAAPDALLRLDLDASGRVALDGRSADAREWPAALAAAVDRGRGIRLRPAPDAPLQAIVQVLDVARSAGARDVALERAPEHAGGR